MHCRQAALTAQQPSSNNTDERETESLSGGGACEVTPLKAALALNLATSHHNVRQNSPTNAQSKSIESELFASPNVLANRTSLRQHLLVAYNRHRRHHSVERGETSESINFNNRHCEAKPHYSNRQAEREVRQGDKRRQCSVATGTEASDYLNERQQDSAPIQAYFKQTNSAANGKQVELAEANFDWSTQRNHLLKHSSSLTTPTTSNASGRSQSPRFPVVAAAANQDGRCQVTQTQAAHNDNPITSNPSSNLRVAAGNQSSLALAAAAVSGIGASASVNSVNATTNNLDYTGNTMMHPSQQQQQQQPANAGGANDGASTANTINTAGQQQLSKGHSSSTSFLANDSYMAGMSSDSELTGNTTLGRHYGHSRPYSGQPRVYHAHPAPRSSNSSSRMSHYSDSAAPSYAVQSANEPILGGSSGHQTATSLGGQQQSVPMYHQAFMPSIAPNASSAPYLAGYGDLPIMQQQALAMPTRPTSGQNQLPRSTRPFKQSMSIDHHSIGPYHQQPTGHHLASPAHSISAPHYEPAQQHPLETLHSAYQSQQHQISQFNYPGESDNRHINAMTSRGQVMRPLSHDHQAYTGQQQRNFRAEMEMIEKQTANIDLYDDESSRALAHTTAALPPRSSSRQLPPTNSPSINMLGNASMSVDHLHHHADRFIPPQVRPSDLQQHLQQHQQQFPNHPRLHEDLYTTHQTTAAATEWLPSTTVPSHHIANRPATQFKQAMSIDHYPISGQQHHYSPVRAAHLSEPYRTSLGYANSSPVGYESPTRAIQSANSDHHNSRNYHQYSRDHEQHLQQQLGSYSSVSSSQQQQRQVQDLHHDPTPNQPQSSNLSHSASRGTQSSSSGKKHSELQHQFSSSSSNSGQSGSLHGSNSTDMSKSLIDQQKANTIARLQHQRSPKHKSSASNEQQQRQQQQTPSRKGYTSVASSSLGTGGGSAFSDTGNSAQMIATTSISGDAHLNLQALKRSGLRTASPSGALEAAKPSASQHHHSGSSKDGGGEGSRSESSTGLPNGSHTTSSLTKKSNSATQLSMTGTKKRLGFRKKQLTSFSVHRSEEVAPLEARHLVKQGSSVSEGDSSMSGDSSSRSWSNSNFKPQTSDDLASMSFIDGLGKGQMISRQGLASPYLGDIQLSLCDRRGYLEVEIIRARSLQAKANKEILPLTYVKLYLVKNRKCLAKAKTNLSSKRTLDPLFQQQLTFHEEYRGCILQSIIWGNFGKMDKKNFMGIAQISLDDLELSDTVISWYKLFLPSSLQTLPSKCLRHTLLSNSTESFTTNTNNS